MTGPAARLALLGAGPRGVGWLERFARNLPQFATGPVVLHLIDPYPPGPGRIWRRAQSPLLTLNSRAADVTMFTDDTSTIEGAVAAGPSLIDWARGVREGTIADVEVPEGPLRDELDELRPEGFATRRLQSLYLDWFYRRTLAALGSQARVVVHRDTALAVTDLPDGRQRVRLGSGDTLTVDAVVYALGHAGSAVHGEQARLQREARGAGLRYLPPDFTADADLTGLPAGEPVIVRGMGLAAVDLLLLLTAGRGGRFDEENGALRYRPSGREPQILIGSRRGVPYHPKNLSVLQGTRPGLQFLTPETLRELAARPSLDFADDVWPLIAKEMLCGYYAELCTGHPGKAVLPWSEFLTRLADIDATGPEVRGLLAQAIPAPSDRLDLDRLRRPLAEVRTEGLEEAQRLLRAYIRDDLARRSLPEHSATCGLFVSLVQAMFAVLALEPAAHWSVRSRRRDLDGWWKPYFSSVASGPPPRRLRELVALSEAGVVTFLGAGLEVSVDCDAGCFRASSATVPGMSVTARSLVDAWLPASRAAESDDPALRDLVLSGAGATERFTDGSEVYDNGKLLVRPTDSRVLRPDGSAHPRRFALGPFTSAPTAGAFSRPATDALALRQNDAAARAVLGFLAQGDTQRRQAARPAPAPSQSLRSAVPRRAPRHSGLDRP